MLVRSRARFESTQSFGVLSPSHALAIQSFSCHVQPLNQLIRALVGIQLQLPRWQRFQRFHRFHHFQHFQRFQRFQNFKRFRDFLVLP